MKKVQKNSRLADRTASKSQQKSSVNQYNSQNIQSMTGTKRSSIIEKRMNSRNSNDFSGVQRVSNEDAQKSARAIDEEALELEELTRAHDERVREERWKLSTRIINAVLIAACIYVVFLIYGVFVTDYQYNSNGEIEPQILTVDDIREKKNFETIMVQYENCRILYEKTLMLDYRLGQGEEDPLTLAPEYEKLLDDVSNLSIKTDAMSIDTKYSKIKEMLLSWIKNDIAVYLQNMSAAISENNSETANKALQDKDRVYSSFSQITSNIVATGDKLTGVDLTDIKEWTPEKYIKEAINGE